MLDISLRPICENDFDFLYLVYASTREDELALTGWSSSQQEAFLKQQFLAQHHHYQKYYPECSFNLVLLSGMRVGRLYVSRWDSEIRIVDIALLAKFRGKQIGSVLIKGLLEESKKTEKDVSIHVEKNNPAKRWYQKLGFQAIKKQNEGVYSLMRTDMRNGKPE